MYICNVCNKSFETAPALNGHKSIHREGGRYSISRRKKPLNKCLSCNKETTNPKYCSIRCFADFEWSETKKAIKNNENVSHDLLKRYLIEQNNQCVLCKITGKWNGKPLTLHLDHIDGNSDNNTLTNVRLLCPNCHSQTDTWCGRNKKYTKRNLYLSEYKKKVGP